MKISIITPVFGHADLTSKFISSVVGYMDNESELIIIDNNSPDNTLQVLASAKKLFANKVIKIYSNNENVGFGAANNIGASIAKSENILFISNDVVILGDFISPIVEVLSQKNVVCGPHLLSNDTGWNSFKQVPVIPYVEGFCMAMHKTNFNMVQGFDEKFFLDMEDLDLCYRLYLAGVALTQVNLPVMHQLGGSFDGLNLHRSDITEQSLQYFMQKWSFTR
jgi:GT2 family glycosyltransferase